MGDTHYLPQPQLSEVPGPRRPRSGSNAGRRRCSGAVLPHHGHRAPGGRDLAYQNKEVMYDILFRASSETMRVIAADPKAFGRADRYPRVLHSWVAKFVAPPACAHPRAWR